MYLSYRQRRNQWAIRVTYTSGAVRVFGPIRERETAEAFLQSRLIAASVVTPRARDILSAEVIRFRRKPWGSADELLGVRLRLPA